MFKVPNPKLVAGYVAVGASLAFAGFCGGILYTSDELNEYKVKAASQQVKVVTANSFAKEIIYKDRIVYQDKIKQIDVPKIIEKEVYKNVCLDEEGLRAFNTFMGN